MKIHQYKGKYVKQVGITGYLIEKYLYIIFPVFSNIPHMLILLVFRKLLLVVNVNNTKEMFHSEMFSPI